MLKRKFVVIQSSFLKKLALASIVIGTSALSLLIRPQSAQAESFNLVWSTEFDSPLSSQQWNIYNYAPFASSQNTCFMASNAYTQNGILNLMISQNQSSGCSSRPYASGGIDTYTYHAQTYGRWEVRAKMPKGYGVLGYIGLFPVNGSWPPEIDFAELIGRQPQNIYVTQHYGTWPNNQQEGTIITQSGVDWTADYHTYALEWVPGQLRYYIDGLLQFTQQQKFTDAPSMMKLAMGTGAGDCGSWSWVGCPDAAASNDQPWPLPTQMQIDYVKIYQYVP
jgi:beta-glucanase (GH16 family)